MMNPFITLGVFTKELFSRNKPNPSYPSLPAVDRGFQSSINGIYVVGDLARASLIKLSLNQGTEVIEHIAASLPAQTGEGEYDLVIVGSGSSGLGAAALAEQKKLKYVVLEANRINNTIFEFTKGKKILAEPVETELKSPLWLKDNTTKEELLDKWNNYIKENNLNIKTHEKVTDVQGKSGSFKVITESSEYTCKNVLLAFGKAGNPRKAGVPGEKENAGKIFHKLTDPAPYREQDIVIYGGGDVALEAALALSDKNKVSLVTIDKEFIFPRKRNIDAVLEQQKQGKLNLHMNTKLKSVDESSVIVENSGIQSTIKCDTLFEMIGAEPPVGFFKKIGVLMENAWPLKRILTLACTFALIYIIYAMRNTAKIPDFGLSRYFHFFKLPPSFWLGSTLYSIIVTAFGIKAMIRWREDSYQVKRYLSLIFFQIMFFFIYPEILLRLIKGLDDYWRAYGLVYAWPLFFHTFFDNPPLFWVAWGLILVFAIIPIFMLWHGKKYCSWICGCGALAETIGDSWRHLSPKGERSQKWEFQGIVVLGIAIITTALVLLNSSLGHSLKNMYSFVVDLWLAAIIAITLYPVYGGKVWCRYWCPLAKYMELLSKWYSRFRISSNDKCIQCTRCSKYCQVGVDVMKYAKNQADFSNKNTSCIGCGICITVCPMHVLKFGKQDEQK